MDAEVASEAFKVLLRHNPTGEERLVDGYGPWDDGAEFLWTEGNYGCDCNRALHFYNWSEDADDRECGDVEFTAVKAVLSDGREVPLEDD
jgi:hypothetical protein